MFHFTFIFFWVVDHTLRHRSKPDGITSMPQFSGCCCSANHLLAPCWTTPLLTAPNCPLVRSPEWLRRRRCDSPSYTRPALLYSLISLGFFCCLRTNSCRENFREWRYGRERVKLIEFIYGGFLYADWRNQKSHLGSTKIIDVLGLIWL